MPFLPSIRGVPQRTKSRLSPVWQGPPHICPQTSLACTLNKPSALCSNFLARTAWEDGNWRGARGGIERLGMVSGDWVLERASSLTSWVVSLSQQSLIWANFWMREESGTDREAFILSFFLLLSLGRILGIRSPNVLLNGFLNHEVFELFKTTDL